MARVQQACTHEHRRLNASKPVEALQCSAVPLFNELVCAKLDRAVRIAESRGQNCRWDRAEAAQQRAPIRGGPCAELRHELGVDRRDRLAQNRACENRWSAEIGRRKHSTEPTSSICPWLCFSADFKRSGETIGKRRYISSMVSIGQSPMAPSCCSSRFASVRKVTEQSDTSNARRWRARSCGV